MTLFEKSSPAAPTPPLAERMRPVDLSEFEGQEDLLRGALGRAVRMGLTGWLILWGPPGSGKTTLARLIAHASKLHFEPFSAVLSGVKDVRAALDRAAEIRKHEGRGTLLFVDEIHRFNRSPSRCATARGRRRRRRSGCAACR